VEGITGLQNIRNYLLNNTS